MLSLLSLCRRRLPPELASWRQKARDRWHWALRRITWLLKFRIRWHEHGEYLKILNVRAITEGLERRKGILRRTQRVNSAPVWRAPA